LKPPSDTNSVRAGVPPAGVKSSSAMPSDRTRCSRKVALSVLSTMLPVGLDRERIDLAVLEGGAEDARRRRESCRPRSSCKRPRVFDSLVGGSDVAELVDRLALMRLRDCCTM